MDDSKQVNWIGTYKCVEEGTKALVVSRAKMIDEVTHKPVVVWIGFSISQGLVSARIWDNNGNDITNLAHYNLKEAIRETST